MEFFRDKVFHVFWYTTKIYVSIFFKYLWAFFKKKNQFSGRSLWVHTVGLKLFFKAFYIFLERLLFWFMLRYDKFLNYCVYHAKSFESKKKIFYILFLVYISNLIHGALVFYELKEKKPCCQKSENLLFIILFILLYSSIALI